MKARRSLQAKPSGPRRGGSLNRTCEKESCQRQPSYGTTWKKPRFCSSHKIEGMVDVRNTRCLEAGCMRQPSYGQEGQRRQYCFAHKREGMVDVKSTRCKSKGCVKHALYGEPGELPQFCAVHKSASMMDVKKRRRCNEEGCERRASYNAPGSKASYCLSHKKEGMVNVNNRRCREPGCQSRPYHSVEGGSSCFCVAHRKASKQSSTHQGSLKRKFSLSGEERQRSLGKQQHSVMAAPQETHPQPSLVIGCAVDAKDVQDKRSMNSLPQGRSTPAGSGDTLYAQVCSQDPTGVSGYSQESHPILQCREGKNSPVNTPPQMVPPHPCPYPVPDEPRLLRDNLTAHLPSVTDFMATAQAEAGGGAVGPAEGSNRPMPRMKGHRVADLLSPVDVQDDPPRACLYRSNSKGASAEVKRDRKGSDSKGDRPVCHDTLVHDGSGRRGNSPAHVVGCNENRSAPAAFSKPMACSRHYYWEGISKHNAEPGSHLFVRQQGCLTENGNAPSEQGGMRAWDAKGLREWDQQSIKAVSPEPSSNQAKDANACQHPVGDLLPWRPKASSIPYSQRQGLSHGGGLGSTVRSNLRPAVTLPPLCSWSPTRPASLGRLSKATGPVGTPTARIKDCLGNARVRGASSTSSTRSGAILTLITPDLAPSIHLSLCGPDATAVAATGRFPGYEDKDPGGWAHGVEQVGWEGGSSRDIKGQGIHWSGN
ncbi:unnamed protein product [Discosporangium mesarthrocarpum]